MFRSARCWMRTLAVAVLMTAVQAYASDAAPDKAGSTLPALEEGVHEPLVERVNQAQSREFATLLKSLDEFIAAHPDDFDVAVERCRFIDHFASLEDEVIESAYDLAEECVEALEQSEYSGEAPVELYLLEQKWGEEATKQGEALLPASQVWTPKQQARLHERLADVYSSTDLLKAGGHATTAIRLDPHSHVRLIAAEYLIRIGAKARGVRTIEEMPKENWNPWQLSSAVKLLVGMEAADAAHRLVRSNPDLVLDASTRALLARSLYASGARDTARALVKEASAAAAEEQLLYVPALRELFELERDHGTTDAAAAAYRRLRDQGYSADPFGRHRLSLSIHHPRAPWKLEDTVGIGALLLVIGVSALLPLLVVAPIHYRSVVKQLRGHLPQPVTPSAPWTLGQVWYALAVWSVSGTGAFYFLDYPTFHAVTAVPLGIDDQFEVLSSERSLGNAMLASFGVFALALLPLLRRMDLRSLFLGTWPIWKSLLMGVGASIGLVMLNAILRAASTSLFQGAVLGTDTVRALQGIHATYGVAAMLLFIAVLVPFAEELLFRGVLLRTMSRYVAFWVAVIAQGALFMVWHEDVTGWPFIFVLALVTAWLARRSGGLLAPITLHATNNAIVALSLIGISQAFEYLK